MAITGINHVVLKVRSLPAADRFYRELLGLRKVGERGAMWFYTAGAHHHDLALVELGERATAPAASATGLFHLCFDVADEAALRELYLKLRAAGAPVSGGVDHGIMRSFYLRDPDGNTIELGVDMPVSQWPSADPFAEDSAYKIG